MRERRCPGSPQTFARRPGAIQPGHPTIAVIARSNSLNTPNMPNSIRPDGVLVSQRLLVQKEIDVAGSQFTQQPDQITE